MTIYVKWLDECIKKSKEYFSGKKFDNKYIIKDIIIIINVIILSKNFLGFNFDINSFYLNIFISFFNVQNKLFNQYL